jgi:hypothetical protein
MMDAVEAVPMGGRVTAMLPAAFVPARAVYIRLQSG